VEESTDLCVKGKLVSPASLCPELRFHVVWRKEKLEHLSNSGACFFFFFFFLFSSMKKNLKKSFFLSFKRKKHECGEGLKSSNLTFWSLKEVHLVVRV
jgi:hypothetical protein